MQECKKCGASWNATKKVDSCPFCGADLQEKKVISTIEDAFSLITEKYGTSILGEPKKFLALLSDYAPSLLKERKLVKVAVESGAYKALYEASAISKQEKELVLKKYVSILHENFFIDVIWAEKVLSWCSKSLSVDLEEFDKCIIQEKNSVSVKEYKEEIVSKQEKVLPEKKLTFCAVKDLHRAYEPNTDTFTIPDGFTYITKVGLEAHQFMKRLIIPASVNYIEPDALDKCFWLRKIEVAEENPNYAIINGRLCEKKTSKPIGTRKYSL